MIVRCYTNRKLNDLDWNSVLYSLPTKNYYYSIYLTLLVKLEIERKEAAEQKRTPMNSEQWRYICTPFMKLNFINSTYKNIFCDFILNRINIQKYFNLNRGKKMFCKFQAEGWEFENILRLLQQFIQTVRQFLKQNTFLLVILDVSQI